MPVLQELNGVVERASCPFKAQKKAQKINGLSPLFHSLENKDVEELYQFVEKGTKVEIIR